LEAKARTVSVLFVGSKVASPSNKSVSSPKESLDAPLTVTGSENVTVSRRTSPTPYKPSAGSPTATTVGRASFCGMARPPNEPSLVLASRLAQTSGDAA
jgi:hypothetical protein